MPKAGLLNTKFQPLHKSLLKLQKLNLPRLPSFWQTDVTGRCGLILNKCQNEQNL